MDATPHLFVGATLTRRMSPLLAFAVGIASHAVLDAIPHYHYAWITGITWKAFVDLSVGTVLVAVVARTATRPDGAVAGAMGAAFPEISLVLAPQESVLNGLLARLPHHEAVWLWGLATQLAVVLAALAWILLSRPHGARRVMQR